MRIRGIEAGWPTCALCKKPCDSIAAEQDLEGNYTVSAFHHGAVERTVISEQQLLALARKSKVIFGEAFGTKALPTTTGGST